MTCVTPPIDIQTDGAAKCSLKCLLHYKYGDSSCFVQNFNTALLMKYDGKSDVVYNNMNYTPVAVYILKPSIHTFSGKPADAEVLIIHQNNQGGFYICVPITIGNRLTKGSYLLKDIIAAAPSIGKSASLNIPDFNANYLIPSSRYFTYQGPDLNQTACTGRQIQYVVFHPRYGSISIERDTFKILDALVQPSYIPVSKGTVFVNMKGTTSNGFAGDGQIYIDCQPTGESEEEVVFKDVGTIPTIPNDILMTILLIVIGVALIYGTFVLMKLFLGNVNKITSASNLK